jgi:altronate dehydratase large subunit
MTARTWSGYPRPDGRIGIRNHVLVMYTVECAHHVADLIADAVPGTEVVGFAGCYGDPYALRMLVELGTHPNVGGVLVISLGCESTNVADLAETMARRGQRVETLGIQAAGGTRLTVERGIAAASHLRAQADRVAQAPMAFADLVVGVECGGSDGTSGLAANPVAGWAVDRLVEAGATAVFSELPELLGCDAVLLERAATPAVRDAIRDGLARAERLGRHLRTFAVSTGNLAGGLSTIEEKSLGALAKSGSKPIDGVLRTAERPPHPGLYLLDKVGDADAFLISHYEENDNDGLVTLLASGCHLLLFTTGRGSVVGSVVAPVIKICGNPRTSARMADNIDVNAGTVIDGMRSVADVGEELLDRIRLVASGERTRAEEWGHREYWIPYKPGRACDMS